MANRNKPLDFFAIGLRIVLGAVFLYAGVPKIIDPAGFAETIHRYQLLPPLLINPTAVVLPWAEALIGLFLIAGIWLPGAVVTVNALLVVFTGALAFNYARGLNIDCGCFAADSADGITLLTLLRDAVFLVMSIALFFILRRTRGKSHR